MKKLKMTLALLVALGAFGTLAGCNNSGENAGNGSGEGEKTGEAEGDHGHDHEGGGHGVGPHDGTVADWGGGAYHVEFTVDHDKQEATVYILGDDEVTASPIDAQEIQLSIIDPAMDVALAAAPQEGDPEGSASRFVGNHESLGVVQEYAGTISGVVDGTPYSGDFAEVAHGDHEH